jgi:hypothetical protein
MTRSYGATLYRPASPDGPGLEVRVIDHARADKITTVHLDRDTATPEDADRVLAGLGFARVGEWVDWPEGVTWITADLRALDPNADATPGDGRRYLLKAAARYLDLTRHGEDEAFMGEEERAVVERLLHEGPRL